MTKLKQHEIRLNNLGRLTKLSDDKFDGEHPNGVSAGNEYTGFIIQPPLVGQSCILVGFYTSTVTEILDVSENNVTFKTLNSTYLFEMIK